MENLEVFFHVWNAGDPGCWYTPGIWNEDDPFEAAPTGWYYWFCQPGCLPEAEFPTGPFDTETEAIEDAKEE